MLLRMIIQQILLGHKSHGRNTWKNWDQSMKMLDLVIPVQPDVWQKQNNQTFGFKTMIHYITLQSIILFCLQQNGIFIFFFRTYSCVYNDACLSGGHGGALAGVFVEAACVWAAEAPRPSAETSVRGDCTSVWVLFLNVLMLCPADGVLFVRAAATEHINCTVILASETRVLFWVKPSVASGLWSFSNQFLHFSFIKIDHVSQYWCVMFTPGILFSFDFNLTILLERDVIRDCLR